MTLTPPGSFFSRRTDSRTGDPVPNLKGTSKIAPAPIPEPTSPPSPPSEASALYEASQRAAFIKPSALLTASASSVTLASDLEDIENDALAGDFIDLNELLDQVEGGADDEWPEIRTAWDGPDPAEATAASTRRGSFTESAVEGVVKSPFSGALEIINLDELISDGLSLLEEVGATTSPTSSANPFAGAVGFAGPRDPEPKENKPLRTTVYHAAKNVAGLEFGDRSAELHGEAVGMISSAVGEVVSAFMQAAIEVALPVIPFVQVIYTNVYKAIQHANRPPVPKGMPWVAAHSRNGNDKVVPEYRDNLKRYLNAAQIRVEQKIKLATARELVSAGDGVLTGIAIGVPVAAPIVAAIKTANKMGAKTVIAMMKEEFSSTEKAKVMDEGLIDLKSELLILREQLRSRKASGISDSEPYRLSGYEKGLLRIAKSLGWVSPKTPETLAGPLRRGLEGGDLHYNPVAKPGPVLDAPDVL